MKAQLKTGLCLAAMCLAIGLSAPDARAFSLLGPFEPWMTTTNGFNPSDEADIGGPMCISNEYRWNVPVVTYGFDQSFLDYFGTNGVAAVESAIQVLNDLPPASQIVLTNYPLDSRNTDYYAQSLSISDLKSMTLPLLLEHMGLTEPTRYVYVLRQWNPVLTDYSNDYGNNRILLFDVFGEVVVGTNAVETNMLSDYVVARNYDPQSLSASPYVNESLYSGIPLTFNSVDAVIEPLAVDPLADAYSAVADDELGAGVFYQGLTRDDVGGLAYLLSTNNVNYETLLPGIYGVGVNSNSFVNGAWRPGVDKITFILQPVDSQSGAFLPTTNFFTDSYITNGILQQQQLARVVSQPDFIFSATDTGGNDINSGGFTRTGTTNWVNNATLNGNTNGAGPGVIQPPVKINFGRYGQLMYSYVGLSDSSDESIEDYSSPPGTFDGSTNTPIGYPVPQTGTNQMIFRMWLSMGPNKNDTYSDQNTHHLFEWSSASLSGTPFIFQTSTNFADWVTLFSVTNNGSISYYFLNNPSSASRFYRLVSQ